ncbi:MAG: SHOCT domain-containing protein [Gemmatimonadota bacterium]
MTLLLSLQTDRWWDHMDGAWGWGMMFFMALFWIAVVALVVWLIIRLSRGGEGIGRSDAAGGGRGDRAEAILRERYARGEIDREAYERMLDDLRRPD